MFTYNFLKGKRTMKINTEKLKDLVEVLKHKDIIRDYISPEGTRLVRDAGSLNLDDIVTARDLAFEKVGNETIIEPYSFNLVGYADIINEDGSRGDNTLFMYGGGEATHGIEIGKMSNQELIDILNDSNSFEEAESKVREEIINALENAQGYVTEGEYVSFNLSNLEDEIRVNHAIRIVDTYANDSRFFKEHENKEPSLYESYQKVSETLDSKAMEHFSEIIAMHRVAPYIRNEVISEPEGEMIARISAEIGEQSDLYSPQSVAGALMYAIDCEDVPASSILEASIETVESGLETLDDGVVYFNKDVVASKEHSAEMEI